MLIAIISIVISFISCIISTLTIYRNIRGAKAAKEEPHSIFSVSQYLKRAEKEHLEILEEQKPFEYKIVLWWGLDGIRLNKDGKTEWITRKKEKPDIPKPGYISMQFQPSQYSLYNPCYNIASQIDSMRNISPQQCMVQLMQNTQMMNTIQSMQNTHFIPP